MTSRRRGVGLLCGCSHPKPTHSAAKMQRAHIRAAIWVLVSAPAALEVELVQAKVFYSRSREPAFGLDIHAREGPDVLVDALAVLSRVRRPQTHDELVVATLDENHSEHTPQLPTFATQHTRSVGGRRGARGDGSSKQASCKRAGGEARADDESAERPVSLHSPATARLREAHLIGRARGCPTCRRVRGGSLHVCLIVRYRVAHLDDECAYREKVSRHAAPVWEILRARAVRPHLSPSARFRKPMTSP